MDLLYCCMDTDFPIYTKSVRNHLVRNSLFTLLPVDPSIAEGVTKSQFKQEDIHPHMFRHLWLDMHVCSLHSILTTVAYASVSTVRINLNHNLVKSSRMFTGTSLSR